MKFYLWGPSGTGKTWLFDAFIRKLNLIDESLMQIPEPQFSIWIEDRMGVRQNRYTLDAQPTQDIDYQEYALHREYLLGDETDKTKIACTHTHQFMMMDGQGDETTGQIAIVSDTDENRAKVLAAHEALKDSDYLIICVERGSRSLMPPDPSMPQDPSFQNAGKHFVERLRHLWNLKRKPGQEIIICFTKSDLYGGKVAGFDAALSRLFGQYGREVGDLLRQLSNSRREPLHFFVSAVGFYHNLEGKVVSNIVKGTNTVAQTLHWNPEGVEEPFFNILSLAEVKTLKSLMPEQKGFLGRLGLGKRLIANSFQKDLLNHYISYENMVKGLNIKAG